MSQTKVLFIISHTDLPFVTIQDQVTSKMLIIFDVSAKFGNEKSLNNVLNPGTYLQTLLFNVLLCFRTGKLGLISDIKQAFLQIEMVPEDRDFFWFIWFDDLFSSYRKLINLRFTRVLFGLIWSPFLLNGTVKSHLLKYTQFTDTKEFV